MPEDFGTVPDKGRRTVAMVAREAARVRQEHTEANNTHKATDEVFNGDLKTRCISHNEVQLNPDSPELLRGPGRVQNARMLRRKRELKRLGAKYVTDRQVPDWIKCEYCEAVLESKRQKRANNREIAEITSKQRVKELTEFALREKGLTQDELEIMTDSGGPEEEEWITITQHEMAIELLKEECAAKVEDALELVKEKDEELMHVTASEIRWREAANELRAQRDIMQDRVNTLQAEVVELKGTVQWQKEEIARLEADIEHRKEMYACHLDRLATYFEKLKGIDLQEWILGEMDYHRRLLKAHGKALEVQFRQQEQIEALEGEVAGLQSRLTDMTQKCDNTVERMKEMAEAKMRRLRWPANDANKLLVWNTWLDFRPELSLEKRLIERDAELREAREIITSQTEMIAIRDAEIAEKATQITNLTKCVEDLTKKLQVIEHEHRMDMWRLKTDHHNRTVTATERTFRRLQSRWQKHLEIKERNWTILIDFLRRRLSWLVGFIKDESLLKEISDALGPSIMASHLEPRIRVDNANKDG
ncbi:hypothetical protein FOL47_007538 [Perkinsus chesapeaki]|uniref:Uncharacterized protein n=1 Tax=Perkinsus chesapeaki TaxID=330153 RepID=A0A7J6MW71_PERCH|nr:hypothetical protein FOL47_007538 [Perkinsus chesapeaki]